MFFHISGHSTEKRGMKKESGEKEILLGCVTDARNSVVPNGYENHRKREFDIHPFQNSTY
jgi:hypothetical protein